MLLSSKIYKEILQIKNFFPLICTEISLSTKADSLLYPLDSNVIIYFYYNKYLATKAKVVGLVGLIEKI